VIKKVMDRKMTRIKMSAADALLVEMEKNPLSPEDHAAQIRYSLESAQQAGLTPEEIEYLYGVPPHLQPPRQPSN
jgi:hypothetical protein